MKTKDFHNILQVRSLNRFVLFYDIIFFRIAFKRKIQKSSCWRTFIHIWATMMPSLQVTQLNLNIVLIKIIKISISQKKNVRMKIHLLFFPRRHLTRSKWAGEFSFNSKMFQTKQKTQTLLENTVNCLTTETVEYSLLGTFSLYQSGSAAFYNGRNASHNKIVFLLTDSECTDHNVRHDFWRFFNHNRLAGAKSIPPRVFTDAQGI